MDVGWDFLEIHPWGWVGVVKNYVAESVLSSAVHGKGLAQFAVMGLGGVEGYGIERESVG